MKPPKRGRPPTEPSEALTERRNLRLNPRDAQHWDALGNEVIRRAVRQVPATAEPLVNPQKTSGERK